MAAAAAAAAAAALSSSSSGAGAVAARLSPLPLSSSASSSSSPGPSYQLRQAVRLPSRRKQQKQHSRRQAVATAEPAFGYVAASTTAASSALPAVPNSLAVAAAVVGGVALAALLAKSFDRGSRKYVQGENTVGSEYDAWTEEGVLESYWGEHIHLGYYNEEERRKGYIFKDFKQAKFDFVDEMLNWSGASQPARILDVGCGIGGTSRHLAKKFPGAKVQGITLSHNQQQRGTQLAAEQGVPNAEFLVMDALAMEFEDDTFDLVWACESGEHMPDKRKYVEEMTRVLKPGGTLVIACWCQKEAETFTQTEEKALQFLYDEWAHPHFISIDQFVRYMEGTGKLTNVGSANWVDETVDSWLHSIWVGVVNPFPVIIRPHIWWKTIREIVTIVRMHNAFKSGLMTYGMMKAVKKPNASSQASQARQLEPLAV
eukprot:jgi/Chlat1/8832/Chrsp91S08168